MKVLSRVSSNPLFRLLLAASAMLALGFVGAAPAQAQYGRQPTACMEIATDYAERLVGVGEIAPLVEAQRTALDSLDALARREDLAPADRLREAESLLRGRDLFDVQRAIRAASRVLDTSGSIVAGWRGLYCPVARPDGGAGLEGQARCDALSARFVDRLRIDRRSPEDTRAVEAREAERQTIQKARITRSERNDLLDLWRLRSEAFDALRDLERALLLQEEGAGLLAGVADAGCGSGRPS